MFRGTGRSLSDTNGCHLTIVSQSFQISSALLNHPLNRCSFHWYHMSLHHAGSAVFRHQDVCWLISHETVVVTYLFHVFVLLIRCCKPSTSVRRIACPCSDTMLALASIKNVCSFVVPSMSVSSSYFSLLSLFCSLQTIPLCHPYPLHSSHPQQQHKHSVNCYSYFEIKFESHDSSNKVLQKPLVPRVPRNRRISALLPRKRLI